ncbi:hypothetical protein G5I_05279 [Acromyrmex echinatior]|uniref:Uncharacterized protein n=1 Tax=Acromyrmex echinatior TaxID=103372 RepID=F4WI10_ACREC|nr:hypothetical protein G5I_05279 [Acromyrmex echinatior]
MDEQACHGNPPQQNAPLAIKKKNHIWVPPDDKVGDHAGSLIASMAIDLATKSSPKFKYTHKSVSFFRDLVDSEAKADQQLSKPSSASPGLVSTRTLQHLWYPDVVVANVLDVHPAVNRQGPRQEEKTTQSELVFASQVENAHSSISARVKSE